MGKGRAMGSQRKPGTWGKSSNTNPLGVAGGNIRTDEMLIYKFKVCQCYEKETYGGARRLDWRVSEGEWGKHYFTDILWLQKASQDQVCCLGLGRNGGASPSNCTGL